MKYRILAILLAMTTASYAVDSSVTGMTQLTAPATNDWMYTIDVSDTTDAAAGTGKKILASDMMTIWISNTAWSGSVWSGINTISPSKNAVYNYFHLMAAADDGKISQLNTTAAGFVPTNASGVIGTARVLTAGNYITITNGDGSAGNPTVAFDPTKLTGNQVWADGSNASVTWTWNLSGTDPVITIGSGLINVTTGSLQVGSVDVVTTSGTQTLTNKTLTTPIISTISNTGTVTLPTSTDTLVARATTDTLTNKRVTARTGTTTSSATPTINTDNVDMYTITAQAAAITSMTTNLTGNAFARGSAYDSI